MIRNEKQLIQLLREAMDFSGLKGLKKSDKPTTLKKDSAGVYTGNVGAKGYEKKADEFGYRGGSNQDGSKPSSYIIARARDFEKRLADQKMAKGITAATDYLGKRNELIAAGFDPNEALEHLEAESPRKNWKVIYKNPDGSNEKCNIYMHLKDLPREVQKELIKDDYDGIHYLCKGKKKSTPRIYLPRIRITRDEQIDGVIIKDDRLPKELKDLGVHEIEVEPGDYPAEMELVLPDGEMIEYVVDVSTANDGTVYIYQDEKGITITADDTIDVVAGDIGLDDIRGNIKNTNPFSLVKVAITTPKGENIWVSAEEAEKYIGSQEEVITINRMDKICLDKGINEIKIDEGVINYETIPVNGPNNRTFYVQVVMVPKPIDFALQRKEYKKRVSTYADDYDLPKGPSTFTDDVNINLNNLFELIKKYLELHFDNYFFANRLTKKGRPSKTAIASKYHQNIYGIAFEYNHHGLGGYASREIIPKELAELRPQSRSERAGIINHEIADTEGLNFAFDENPQVEQGYSIADEPAIQDFFFKIKNFYKKHIKTAEEASEVFQEINIYQKNLTSLMRKYMGMTMDKNLDDVENLVATNIYGKYTLRQLTMDPKYKDDPMSHPMLKTISIARTISEMQGFIANLSLFIDDLEKSLEEQKIVTPKDLTGPTTTNESKRYSLMNIFYPNHKKSSQSPRKSQFTKRY